eukprot:TRINITY_DN1653_c0_g2_i1.p1 TRINITY_DN1653_c0_g2~~TRINITY_DN1653_c0_g2_i1.p1  ORF type:complete len:105 (+),score=19.03 TRINITY_DN1653_c0_g2_i1:60-374(+)
MLVRFLAFGMMAVGGAYKVTLFAYRKAMGVSKGSTKQFFKGGFYPTMTRREAQLILSIREGATQEQIRESHRRLMLLNHPDNGGSTFLATKINEAKEFLVKGKQ